MIRIAFEAIATLPSSVGYERIRAPNGDYHVWLEPRFVDRLRARPGESYSDVILRLAEVSAPPRQEIMMGAYFFKKSYVDYAGVADYMQSNGVDGRLLPLGIDACSIFLPSAWRRIWAERPACQWPRAASVSGVNAWRKAWRSAMSATYRIEFMNGGERVKAVNLEGEPLEEAIEVAQAGMEKYEANFARIVDNDGVEVWSGRNDAPRS
jgi:hypothetical protein